MGHLRLKAARKLGLTEVADWQIGPNGIQNFCGLSSVT
jgi:hypothetical protein